MSRVIKHYRVAQKTVTPGLRPMEKKDMTEAHALLINYFKEKKFKLYVEFSLHEFKHWVYPREGVVNSYVVEDPETGKLTDMISFYTLSSTVTQFVNHPTYNVMKAAYSFYNVSTKSPLEVLMKDALILAKKLDFDVFNALDVMENKKFLDSLKYGIGSGHLQYYLYNWQGPLIPPNEVGLVL